MTPPTFAILSGLVEERLGLWYSLDDKPLFESKVSSRALELGFESVLDYYYCLRYDDPAGVELAKLAEALVVNETFFFREYDQVDAVLSNFVAPQVRAGQRPRIWCAACATGEEPYSIAMWLDERGILDSVDLIASDISGAALNIAKIGRYRPRSLRQIPDRVADPARWIAREQDTLIVSERIRAAIQWHQLNLLDNESLRELGSMDVVVCRNVLIYFRDDVVRRVVNQLGERLKVGGVLLVGVTESLMRFGTELVCEERDGAFLYRKAC
jgi:chemotaxis protein methyltransferase CheR